MFSLWSLALGISSALMIDIPVEHFKYTIEEIQGFKKIILEGGIIYGSPGAPELPGFVYTFSLPQNKRLKNVRVVEGKWEQITGEFYIYPVQKDAIIGGEREFIKPDSVIYNTSDYYPQNIIHNFHSGNLRGYSIGQILIVPFRYNPVLKRLEVLKGLKIEMEFVNSIGVKPIRQTKLSSSFFAQIMPYLFDKTVLHHTTFTPEFSIEENPDDLTPTELPSLLGPPVDLVIITTEDLVSAYGDFARLKKLLGFNTAIRTLNWIKENYSGVDDAERIRNFIKDGVEKWGVSIVLLGNDVPGLPTRWVWIEYVTGSYPAHITTDLYYSDLDGNWNFDGDDRFGEVPDSVDFYPDVFVGRIPAHNSLEVTGYNNKIRSYIFDTCTPPNSLFPWHEKSLFVTSMFWNLDDSYYIAKNQLSPLLPPYFLKSFLNERSKQEVFNALYDGYNLITWLAHGDVNLMRVRTYPRENVNNFDFDSLTNNVYPLLVVITCYTGPFQEDCLGEHWVMNPQGGGIGYIGPTSSSAAYNHLDYVRMLFNRLFSSTLGDALAGSKIPWIPYAQFDNWHRVFQYSLNLLGDPTLKMWNLFPHRADSILLNKDTLAIGIDTIRISIFPQIDTFSVVFYKENEIFIKNTGAMGVSITPVKTKSSGFLKYTIISDGFTPYIDSIYVKPSVAYTVYHHYRIIDTLGNGNGIPNPDETVELYLGLINNGNQPAGSVNLRIASGDSFITILIDTTTYDTIQPGENRENLTPLKLKLSPEIPDRYGFNISLEINCGTSIYDTCQIIAESPILSLFTQKFSNIGAEYKIIPFVENQGHCDAESVYGLISSYSDTITILDSIAHFDLIWPGGIVSAQDTLRLLLTYPGALTYKFSLYYKNLKIQEQRIVLRTPPRIDSLWAFGKPMSINLNWTSVPNVRGYRIYRATGPSGSFEFIKNPLTPVAYFEDLNVQQNLNYYYYITVVDSSMNEGMPSDTIRAQVNPVVAPGWPRRVYGYLFSSPNFGDLDTLYPGLEITVCGRDGSVYCWHYDGTPVGNNPDGIIFHTNYEIWSSPAIGDMNCDGITEVCFGIRRPDNNLYLLTKYDTTWIPLPGFPKSLPGGILGSPAISDIDGDGDLEIFIITENGGLYAFHHTGEGVYSPDGLLKQLYGWHGGSPAIGDIDDDGDLEIVACGGSNSDSLFVWDRYGNYLEPFPVAIAKKMSFSPVLGDVSGNGDLEICVYSDSTETVHLIDRYGNIIWQQYIPSLGDVEAYPVIADLVGDGRPEIIVGSNQGFMSLVVFDSAGNLQPGFPVSLGHDYKLPIVADVDGDSVMDLICGAADWNLYAFHNNGNLVSGFPVHFGIRIEQSPAVFDIDNDGRLEMMVGANDYNFWVFKLNSRVYKWPKFRYDQYNSGCYRGGQFLATEEIVKESLESKFYLATSPNPFRNAVVIKFQIPKNSAMRNSQSEISLRVYDVSGRLVKSFNHLTNYPPKRVADGGTQPFNQIVWFGDDNLGRRLPSGVYFIRLETEGFSKVKKVIMLR